MRYQCGHDDFVDRGLRTREPHAKLRVRRARAEHVGPLHEAPHDAPAARVGREPFEVGQVLGLGGGGLAGHCVS